MSLQDTSTSSHAPRTYRITQADLPLCCPSFQKELWNSHPRVYLPIIKTGYAICPYCETSYYLVDKENATC